MCSYDHVSVDNMGVILVFILSRIKFDVVTLHMCCCLSYLDFLCSLDCQCRQIIIIRTESIHLLFK